MAGVSDRGGPALRRLPGHAVHRPGRRGRHRGPAAAHHPDRARPPRRTARAGLPVGRPRPARPQPVPGIAEIGAPVLVTAIGRPDRFPTTAHFRSYTGPTPRASETGNTDRNGQPMSKAGSSLLRTTLVRATDTARNHDPQLAKIYYTQLVDRGAEHITALCVVAAALAERSWAVMRHGIDTTRPQRQAQDLLTPGSPIGNQSRWFIAEGPIRSRRTRVASRSSRSSWPSRSSRSDTARSDRRRSSRLLIQPCA
ncbi:MAG: transposase [Pseudonocardiaceae bacterium]|nr:transposase [Pseudonocardiaceae bacterium]